MIVPSDMPLLAWAAEQSDLGRGVKPETKQKADRKEVPASRHQLKQRSEQPRKKTPVVEQDVEIRRDKGLAGLDRVERSVNRDQNEHV
jgi:hypothetical protein